MSISLLSFIKGFTDPKVGLSGCANYDHHYGGCLYGDCLVELGKRCKYFERSVLPTANDTGIGEDMYFKYSNAVSVRASDLKKPNARLCPDCGNVRLHRCQRYCDSCTKKRRRVSNRKRQKNYRNKKCLNVTN